MSICKIEGCKKLTIYTYTKLPYCEMHKARIRRHGYPELKKDAYQSLEKLPHKIVDIFIRKNYHKMIDKEMVKELKKKGIRGVNVWTVRYRRGKLGIKKYLYGEIKKHKAWIRDQAIKKYGDKCELCGYKICVDAHHIIPKYQGGNHEIDNLIIVCPNCHALITREIITLKNRKDISSIQKKIFKLLKSFYPNFG